MSGIEGGENGANSMNEATEFDLDEAVLFEACGETEGDPASPERTAAVLARLPAWHPVLRHFCDLEIDLIVEALHSPEQRWVHDVVCTYRRLVKNDEVMTRLSERWLKEAIMADGPLDLHYGHIPPLTVESDDDIPF
jgi:hypothetical protein